ncbi:tRNA 2-thiouridine(34) synthase MnmA [Acidiphilium sp.]|uniref:tRNA 2-thiouridine(34) synthase MnmA n=1 Tax=Acidiphilium sp. TaxID=527 RepID=UPI003D06FA83
MRIVVAMSGGVDSSVVAGLMHAAGHEVIGVTLQLYDHGAATGRKGACCAGQDIHDARAVADRLGIAHYVIDAEAAFRKAVIGDFADSYAEGRTPVPCVRCNQHLKFGDLLTLARDLGAEALATGHYVRREEGQAGAELHAAADAARDQSWFLFATTRDQLEFARFPLGAMADKNVVRAEAARMGLQVADKPDSQDICFVPSGSYADIVAAIRPDAGAVGDIVDDAGTVLGQHQGIARYTVGQGKRLGAASGLVVTRIEAGRRRIVVGKREAGSRVVRFGEPNWLIDPPAAPFRARVKLRAREVAHHATIDAGQGLVMLDDPVLAAPGQACVIYQGTRVLGGGFII